MAKSELERNRNPDASKSDVQEVASSHAAFAVGMYRALASERPTQNLAFSPYSISIALAMLYAGAGGETASEMARTMHLPLPQERLHSALDVVDRVVESHAEKDAIALRTANSLWGSAKTHFEKPFLDILAKNYGAGVRLADFAADPEGSRKRINAWVASETRDKIPELFAKRAIDEGTSFVLASAIYFDGKWAKPFDAKQTRTEEFFLAGGPPVGVPTMHPAERLSGSYTRSSAFDAVELPYAGKRFAMDIIVPRGSLEAFESTLTAEAAEAILQGLTPNNNMDVSMPRFALKGSAFDLKTTLESLGMHRVFDNTHSDFRALGTSSDGPLSVEHVPHAAEITVDEEGTEAAATTAAVGTVGSGRPDDPVRIAVDRPFVFLVRHLPTRAILFAGRVIHPLQR
jgi:serpin B